MNRRRQNCWKPTEENLAAYADGELCAADRLRFEEWLAENPEAEAEVESQRHARRLFLDADIPQPTEERWNESLLKIESALRENAACAAAKPGSELGRFLRFALACSTTAAALLWILLVIGQGDSGNSVAIPVETLPVASSGDVEIHSIDGCDASAVVVGDVPVKEPLVLAKPGEVMVKTVAKNRAGKSPVVRSDPNGEFPPMIMPPFEADSALQP